MNFTDNRKVNKRIKESIEPKEEEEETTHTHTERKKKSIREKEQCIVYVRRRCLVLTHNKRIVAEERSAREKKIVRVRKLDGKARTNYESDDSGRINYKSGDKRITCFHIYHRT